MIDAREIETQLEAVMKFIGQTLFAMLLCATALAHSVSVTQEPKTEDKPAGKTIKLCWPALTPAGRQSGFHFTFIYRIKMDAEGTVEKFDTIRAGSAGLVEEDKLIECIKTWRLKPLAVYLVAVSVGTISSQQHFISISEKGGNSIKVCRPELTALGKAAYFHLNFQYLVKTDAGGAVEKITKILGEKYAKFVQEDKLIKCMETWKLKPSTDYFVTVSFGTTSAEHHISVSEKGGEKIKLIL